MRNLIERQAWAASQRVHIVLDDLLEKYKLQYERQAQLGDNAAARLYADTTVRLVNYGVNFSSAMTFSPSDPVNSPDWSIHYNWARTTNVQTLINETENRLRTLFHFFMEEAKNFLIALFTWESVYLARMGGYSNPARNDTNPTVHFNWAMSVPLDTVRDDLIEKYNLQYDRLYENPWAFLLVPAFYTLVSVRLNSLGVDFGWPAANSLDYGVHFNWALNVSAQQVKDETARRLRLIFAELSKT